mmetsp:Transcript_24007/g.51193  ORF Transcript_24007/g.51193 Transcript_24007/m.51193 type:complete len:390 (+) Transcript_24007:2-1171(+)
MPTARITRLKVVCHNYLLNYIERISIMFPCLERLHMVCRDDLAALCEYPDFLPPADFRLSLKPKKEDKGGITRQRESWMFMASHLFALPTRDYACGRLLYHTLPPVRTFFSSVQRFQMSELATEFRGQGHIMEVLQGLPQLRRLGTIDAFSASQLMMDDETVFRCQHLEELVVSVATDKVHLALQPFWKLDVKKKTSSILRLHVHLVCNDGLVRFQKKEVEQAFFASWYAVAMLLRPGGWICLSVNLMQLMETAIAQFPWQFPGLFCLDAADYVTDPDSVPRCTPLANDLPYYEVDEAKKPSATLASQPGIDLSSPRLEFTPDEPVTTRARASTMRTPAAQPLSPTRKSNNGLLSGLEEWQDGRPRTLHPDYRMPLKEAADLLRDYYVV